MLGMGFGEEAHRGKQETRTGEGSGSGANDSCRGGGTVARSGELGTRGGTRGCDWGNRGGVSIEDVDDVAGGGCGESVGGDSGVREGDDGVAVLRGGGGEVVVLGGRRGLNVRDNRSCWTRNTTGERISFGGVAGGDGSVQDHVVNMDCPF